jgi:hypothetical protein
MEEWRTIEGSMPVAEVSNLGRVRSVRRVRVDARGNLRVKNEKLRKLTPDRDGYPCVGICYDGKVATKKVHQLVLEAFVGPRPDGMECLHDDHDKKNNRLSNLSYGTHRQNQIDGAAAGLIGRKKLSR